MSAFSPLAAVRRIGSRLRSIRAHRAQEPLVQEPAKSGDAFFSSGRYAEFVRGISSYDRNHADRRFAGWSA